MASQTVFRCFNIVGQKYLLNVRTPCIYYQSAGMKQKTKDLIKDLRIPDKPKKPLTPYFRYLSEHRSSVAQKNPGLKLTDVAKKCAEDWKSVDPAVKEKYDKEYKSELEKYTEKYLEYQAKLTDEQRSALKLASDEKRSEKQKRKLNKLYKETNKPKRPISAYILFALEYSKTLNKTPLQAAEEVKQKWANLSDAKKEEYKKKFEQNRAEYEKKMQEWEAKMIEEGKSDLVRASSDLLKPPSRIRKSKKQSSE